VPPESVSPEELADAYWGNYERRQALEKARGSRPYEAAAGDKIVVEREGWRVIAHKRGDDEPDEPETGLEWGWAMVNCIAHGETGTTYTTHKKRGDLYASRQLSTALNCLRCSRSAHQMTTRLGSWAPTLSRTTSKRVPT
jgi:hypothetical protein